jgi:tRNA threonylcarbamoyladenosine biosynthesis protein TsaB
MTVWLALDTATDTASVALHDGAVLAESTWTSRRRHTVELAPRVERMVVGHGVSFSDLAGIAVAIGPGSYTGLRISLSLAKGIALSVGTPVVGVPTLDILAASLAEVIRKDGGGDLYAVLRAGRGRIVAARYPQGGGGWPDPSELTVETVAEFAERARGPAWVAGELDAPARELLSSIGLTVLPPEMSVRRAGWLAALGRRRERLAADPAGLRSSTTPEGFRPSAVPGSGHGSVPVAGAHAQSAPDDLSSLSPVYLGGGAQ